MASRSPYRSLLPQNFKKFLVNSKEIITKNPRTLSSWIFLVEMTGFEPAASSSRTKRATKLRYISI